MNKDITIAFINNYFDIGGVQKTCFSIAESLIDRGFTFHFVNLGSDSFLDGFANCGTCFHSPNPVDVIRYLQENNIDIVQTNNCDAGSYLAYLANVPLIVERLAGMNSAFLFDKSPVDCIIGSTNNVTEKANLDYPRKYITKIYNGVDLSVFHPQDKNKQLLSNLGIDQNEILIGYCGRISREKCIDKLIDISHKISKKYPFRLIFLGDFIEDSYKQTINDKIQNLRLGRKIIFTNGVENPSTIMNIFDIGVLASGTHTLPDGETKITKEGLSNSVMEMLAMGIPVVATSSGETSTLVKNGFNGFLIDLDNMDMFCDKLSSVIENKELREQMGKNAHQFIRDNFSRDNMISDYEKTYRYLLSDDFTEKYPNRRKDMDRQFLSKEFSWEDIDRDSKKILVVKSGNEQLTDYLMEEIKHNFTSPEIDILCHKRNYNEVTKYDGVREVLTYDKSMSFDSGKMDDIMSCVNAEKYDCLFFLFNNFLGKNYDNVVELIDHMKSDKKIVITGLLKKYIWQ